MANSENPKWVKIKPKEVETLILDLAKESPSPEKIGLILRDKHGIPKSKPITGKRISEILEENGIDSNSELRNIKNNVETLKTHISKNKHDYTASKALTKKLWAVQKAE